MLRGRKRRRWKKFAQRDQTKTVQCVCGDTRSGYAHRDNCPAWRGLTNDQRSNHVRASTPNSDDNTEF